MEVVSSDGSKLELKPGRTMELGRARGLCSSDKTISRRQISFYIPKPFTHNQGIVAQFEILGLNPVYVSKGDEVKIFRRSEKGEMGDGDMFCVSAKNPVWYTLRRVQNCGESVRRHDSESELAENLDSGSGFKGFEDLQQEGVDISSIDPVKEFGLVVIGHEFDSYPKKAIKDIKNWDWFLYEMGKDSNDDDDEDNDERKKVKGSGRKKGIENDDDEEWTGESEDEKVSTNKSSMVQRRPTIYVTRSKDHGKRSKDTSKSKSIMGMRKREVDEEEDEDEDDETLGGFIVDDENVEDEEEIGDEEEQEEEEELELGDEEDEDE